VIEPSLSGLFTLSIEQCPDPSIPVKSVDHPSARGSQPASLHLRTSDIALAGDPLREDASEAESERRRACRRLSSQRTLVGQ
jgi:hypothetical protein